LIAQETKLEERFKTDIPTVEELGDLLDGIAKARAELRFIHLNTHLKTPEILSADTVNLTLARIFQKGIRWICGRSIMGVGRIG